MGRHSLGERGTEAPGPVAGAQQQPWTVWDKALAVLCCIAAVIVIASVVSALHRGGPESGSSASAQNVPAYGASAQNVPAHGAAAQNVPVNGASLPQLPVHTALKGREAVAWADAALVALGAPRTSMNVQTMVDWFANEGTPHDLNNPLNLQTPYGGSKVSTANGSTPDARIQAYPSPADFVAAFPREMKKGSYPAIVSALKAGKGLEGSAATHEIASELWVYSGGGYDTIPAAYNS